MARQLVQCLLVSLLHLVPGVLPTSRSPFLRPPQGSSASINGIDPASGPSNLKCSVDDIVVNWLTIQDIGRIVSRWAAKEGIPTVRVLHRLENSLITAEQVHGLQSSEPSSKESSSDEDFHKAEYMNRLLMAQSHNRPSVVNLLPLPPRVNVLPPLPPPPPPPAALLPPDLPFNDDAPPPNLPFTAVLNPSIMTARLREQQMLPFPGSLRPPPDVTVRIEEGVFSSPIPPVQISVSPRMAVTDALRQAAIKFSDDTSPPSPSDINFYKVSWGYNKLERCFVIRTVGNLSTTGSYVWEVRITERLGQEIWRGVCLPSVEEIHVRPGMTITLNYVKGEDLLEDI